MTWSLAIHRLLLRFTDFHKIFLLHGEGVRMRITGSVLHYDTPSDLWIAQALSAIVYMKIEWANSIVTTHLECLRLGYQDKSESFPCRSNARVRRSRADKIKLSSKTDVIVTFSMHSALSFIPNRLVIITCSHLHESNI